MPDKKTGWRKKIQTRPSALQLNNKAAAPSDDSADRLRRHSDKISWRSRPQTPSDTITPTSLQPSAEDTRSEVGSEASSPRRTVRPKFSRYLSGYRSLPTKNIDFQEPWSATVPLSFEPLVDPLASLQSVFTHMNTLPTEPIPVEFNSGLFRIFEDYRAVRNEKEHAEHLLQVRTDGFRRAEETWKESESHYQAEIRRLELLIARESASGMVSVMRMRQNSILQRRRVPRKTTSSNRFVSNIDDVPVHEIDEQIRLRSQKVLLHRPSSPSGRMAALSKQFSRIQATDDLIIGTPPSQDKEMTLSRKVKSELDLSKLEAVATPTSITDSIESGFSRTGDPLPDEIEPGTAVLDLVTDCDAFVALKELGTLVARKKGIVASKFSDKLMQLFINSEAEPDVDTVPRTGSSNGERTWETDLATSEKNELEVEVDTGSTPKGRLRHFRSQPQLSSEQRRRRHFSFEPGDDQMKKLGENVVSYETIGRTPSGSTGSSSPPAETTFASIRSQNLNAECQKPSKIPSPVQRPALGSVRRENSVSSLQTVIGKAYGGDRRNSNSSLLTVFRESSRGSLRPVSQNRSNSDGTLHCIENPQPEFGGSPRIRTSAAAIAAARAANRAEEVLPSKSNTKRDTIGSAVGSSNEIVRRSRKDKPENDATLERY